jgi:hypothetical protein
MMLILIALSPSIVPPVFGASVVSVLTASLRR